MTMDAKRKQSGQSLVEMAIILPVFVLMFYILISVNTAISMATVNQQYARGMLYGLLFNHRYYPEIYSGWNLRTGVPHHRWWIGVDDKQHGAGDDEAAELVPRAPVELIGGKNIQAKDDEQVQSEYPDVSARKNVRIRVMSFICVPPLLLNGKLLNTEGNLGDSAFLSGSIQYCGPD